MNFANKISTFRILSVPFYIAAFVYYSPQRDYLRYWALGIFIAAAISDALDGYIARKNKQYTKAGLILDPLGDKLVLVSSFICLYFIGDFPQGIKFPLSVTLIVVSRDAIILLGTLVVYMVKQSIDVHPTRWGKLTTTFQMASVIAVLLQLRWSFLFWWPAVFFTVISGVDYVMRGFKILYAVDIHTKNHLNANHR